MMSGDIDYDYKCLDSAKQMKFLYYTIRSRVIIYETPDQLEIILNKID